MIAKLTNNNQLTLPKAVIQQISIDINEIDYFSISYENGKIILTPVMLPSAMQISSDAVRNKLQYLGITQEDISEAISWGRGNK